jgi:hypothetical protein
MQELMEYVEQEDQRRAKETLEKKGIEVSKLEFKFGAPAGI